MNLNLQKKHQGFTLIELLVVISIVGLISSIVLSALNEGRNKATDAKMMAELKSFQTAVELYKTDKGLYPGEITWDSSGTVTSGAAIWADDSGTVGSTAMETTELQLLVNPKYISNLPHAPKYPQNYNNSNGTGYFIGYASWPGVFTQAFWAGQFFSCGRNPITKYFIVIFDNNRTLKLPKAEFYHNGAYHDYNDDTITNGSGRSYCVAV